MSFTPQLNKKYDNNKHNDELIEECNAAFICITNNSTEKFRSVGQLTKGKSCLGYQLAECFFYTLTLSFAMLWKKPI